MEKDILLRKTADKVKEALDGLFDSIVVERVVLGIFFSGVKLSCGSGGLCFTPIKEIPEAVCCPSSARTMPLSGRMRGRAASLFVEDIFSGNILKRALGIAVLNALSAYVWERGGACGYEIIRGVDAFDGLEFKKGQKTVVVGALVPVLRTLLEGGHDFHVLEMDKRTLKGRELEHFLPAGEYESVVPYADNLIITGVTILNGSLAPILKCARPDARILVTGPTAGMLPDVFFEAGVTDMGSVIVTKPDEALDMIAEGGSGYHIFGKSADRVVIRNIDFSCRLL